MRTVKVSPNYFTNPDKHYLGYKVEGGWCGFGISAEAVDRICPKLRDGEEWNLSEAEFDQLHTAHTQETFKRHKGFQVPKYAKLAHLNEVYDALETRAPLLVEYEEGCESFPPDEERAFISSDGRVHVVFVGKSTGPTPIYLSLPNRASVSGEAFSFHGIKRVEMIA